MECKIPSLIEGTEIHFMQEDFPVNKAVYLGKDCGDFLHFIGKDVEEENLYGLFLKEELCELSGRNLIYHGGFDFLTVGRIKLNSGFGRKLNHKYFDN